KLQSSTNVSSCTTSRACSGPTRVVANRSSDRSTLSSTQLLRPCIPGRPPAMVSFCHVAETTCERAAPWKKKRSSCKHWKGMDIQATPCAGTCAQTCDQGFAARATRSACRCLRALLAPRQVRGFGRGWWWTAAGLWCQPAECGDDPRTDECCPPLRASRPPGQGQVRP